MGAVAELFPTWPGTLRSPHLAEDRATYPGKRLVPNGSPVLVDGLSAVADGGWTFTTTTSYRVGRFELPGGDVRHELVGRATAHLVPVRDVVDFAARWFTEHC